MEININEYIRTNEGIIDKVDRYSIGSCVYHCKNGMCIDECETVGIPISDIKSHSFNIIDLIEEGDYVNGNEIALEAPNPDPLCDPIYGYFDRYGELVGIIENEDIKSIVTKEQFKSAEYEV